MTPWSGLWFKSTQCSVHLFGPRAVCSRLSVSHAELRPVTLIVAFEGFHTFDCCGSKVMFGGRWLKKGLFSVPVARIRSLTAATNGLDGSKWCLEQGQRSSLSLSRKMSSIAFTNYNDFIVVSFCKTSLGLRNRFNLSTLQIFSPLFLMTLRLHRSGVFKYNLWQQLRGRRYFF